jgi:hypothetical protein
MSIKSKTLKRNTVQEYNSLFDNCFCRYFDHFLEQGPIHVNYSMLFHLLQATIQVEVKKTQGGESGKREGGKEGEGEGGRRGRGRITSCFPPSCSHSSPLPLSEDYTHAPPLCVPPLSGRGVVCMRGVKVRVIERGGYIN